MGKHHNYRDGEDITPIITTTSVADIPTQVLYPWRTALRTLTQYVAGLAVTGLVTLLAKTLGINLIDLSSELTSALTAVIWGLFTMLTARIMAYPQVNMWLTRFIPFLAAPAMLPPQNLELEG